MSSLGKLWRPFGLNRALWSFFGRHFASSRRDFPTFFLKLRDFLKSMPLSSGMPGFGGPDDRTWLRASLVGRGEKLSEPERSKLDDFWTS